MIEWPRPEHTFTRYSTQALNRRAWVRGLYRSAKGGVVWAQQAAETLAAEGFSVEVIDLRTLLPWDVATVTASVHEAPFTGGFGGELAATISAECFQDLDAPVLRLGGLDMPVPFSKALEEVFMPKARLLDTLRGLLTS